MTLERKLDTLSSLDLSKRPYVKVRKMFKQLGKIAVINFTMHPRKNIIRARSNHPNKAFSEVSKISFKPANLCTAFQRASSPYRTMFYGCIVSAKEEERSLIEARTTALTEASYLYRNGIDTGEEKLTYSRWLVTKDIPLVAIDHHQDFENANEYINELYLAYQSFLKKTPDLIQRSILISEFFADQFAKEVADGDDFEYLLSAAFTDLVVESGYGGVLFPSVQFGGRGFNVAIAPHFVRECMSPIVAGECMIYKKGKRIIVDNLNNVELKNGQESFQYTPITDPSIHLGRDKILKMLEEG